MSVRVLGEAGDAFRLLEDRAVDSLTGIEQRFVPDRHGPHGVKLLRAAHLLSESLAAPVDAMRGVRP